MAADAANPPIPALDKILNAGPLKPSLATFLSVGLNPLVNFGVFS